MKRTLLTGRIFTADESRLDAGAILVEGDRIAAVGDEDDFGAADATRVLLPDGALLCPAFTDCHTHFVQWARRRRLVDLKGTRSMGECLDRVAAYARRLPPGAWIRGGGWAMNDWDPPAWPTASDLAPAVGDRPAILSSNDGHSVWLSPAAMAAVGLTAETPDPPGGVFVRDESGVPVGVACEEALTWVNDRAPRPSVHERADAVLDAYDAAHSVGVTGVGDYGERDDWEVYDLLRSRDELRIRVIKTVPRLRLTEMIERGLRTGDGDEWFRAGPQKLYADGSLGSRTAFMLEPFEGTGDRGVATLSEAELREHASRAAKHGIATAVHAIGDAANRRVLDVFGSLAGGARLRHRVEHAQLLHPDDVPRFARLGVIASVQPSHILSDRDAADRLWGKRSSGAYAFRSLLDSGARLAFGSDAPIENLDPREGILAVVHRSRPDDVRGPWFPAERLTATEALLGFTSRAAYACCAENERGKIAPGMLADFVVLDRDPRKIEAHEMGSLSIASTFLGGRCVYGGI